jgi:hypothetical protein
VCIQTKNPFCFRVGSIIVPRYFSSVSSLRVGIVDIASIPRAGCPSNRGPIPGLGKISRLKVQRPVLGSTQPPAYEQWVRFPAVVKRPECEAHRSPPSSTKAKNEGSYISTPPHPFTVCTGTNLPSCLPSLLRFGQFIIIFGIMSLSILYEHSAYIDTFINTTVPVTDPAAKSN